MRPHRHILAAAAVLCAVLAAPAPSVAQIIQLDPAPGQAPAAPSGDGAIDPVQPVLPEARGRRPAPELPGTRSDGRRQLVPLRPAEAHAQSPQVPRLTGEVSVGRFVLFLPSDPGATELRLSHRSSIDVLPEQSVLRVAVNGTVLGEVAPDNFSGFALDALPVPAGVLRGGRNLVEVEARHTHRVACGPDASFAVWTELQAGRSGVALPADAFQPDPMGFLSAIAAQAADGRPVVIRRPDPSASLIGAAPFVAEVSAAIGGAAPAIRSAPHWTVIEGPAPLARVTVFPAGTGPDRPRFARGGDGALVLLLREGADFSGVSRLFSNAADAPDFTGPRILPPGQALPLAELAPDRLVGEGRYFVLTTEFRLPWDWLMLTSAKARLDLDYRFPAGLPEGSLMLIKVNGTTVRMLPLDIDGGMALPTLPVSFPARLMRPGSNRLDFEVLVPGDPVDRACPPLPGPTVEISGESRLYVPPTPRMSLSSIDETMAGLAPGGIELTEAAAERLPPGFAPQIAAVLTRPRPGAPGPDATRRLVIGTLADLDTIRPAALGENLRAVSEALTADTLPALVPRAASATAWDVVEDGAESGATAPNGLLDLPLRLVSALRRMALGSEQPLETWLEDRTAQAAMLQPDPGRPGDIWLILGPRADPADIVRTIAASRDGAGGPTGQLAIYSADAGWESWASPERALRLHESINIGNLREIMGTYATLSPLQFIAATLVLTLLSVGAALGLLFTLRGRDR